MAEPHPRASSGSEPHVLDVVTHSSICFNHSSGADAEDFSVTTAAVDAVRPKSSSPNNAVGCSTGVHPCEAHSITELAGYVEHGMNLEDGASINATPVASAECEGHIGVT